jgi:hypothetical protein
LRLVLHHLNQRHRQATKARIIEDVMVLIGEAEARG